MPQQVVISQVSAICNKNGQTLTAPSLRTLVNYAVMHAAVIGEACHANA